MPLWLGRVKCRTFKFDYNLVNLLLKTMPAKKKPYTNVFVLSLEYFVKNIAFEERVIKIYGLKYGGGDIIMLLCIHTTL